MNQEAIERTGDGDKESSLQGDVSILRISTYWTINSFCLLFFYFQFCGEIMNILYKFKVYSSVV